MRFFAILICLTFSSQLVSQHVDSTCGINGLVIDIATGDLIADATVHIAGSSITAITNNKGQYSIYGIKPAVYRLYVTLNRYRSDTVNVAVYENQVSKLNIPIHLLNKDGSDSIVPISIVPIKVTFPYVRWICPASSYSRKKVVIVSGVQGALAIGSLIALDQLWYKQYPRTSFHTFDDNREWLQMDKIGHAQTAYTTGLISSRLLYWTGMKYNRATWIGGLTGFAYLSAIEIMDGYSEGWGFSIGDMAANTAGSALFISQQLTWNEQRVQMKFGFRRSGYADYRPELLGNGYQEEILKDYNGQTYWLSVNVASFLKEETRFPQWLNVAFGYGANGMTGGHENPVMYNSAGNQITLERYRQYYLSLDIDLQKLPVKSRFLKWVFTFVSFVKIPAPGIELSKNGVRPILLAF